MNAEFDESAAGGAGTPVAQCPPTTPPEAMRAQVQRRYGTPEVLTLETLPCPKPGAGEVLVRVHAASVNPADWFLLTGSPWPARLEAGLFRPRRLVPGRDLAGVVVAVGPGVTRLGVGDRVYGENTGAYAEFACVPEKGLGPMPRNLDFAAAAAVPLAGITALQGLRAAGPIRAGQRVLINGASGGVGTFAVQLARAWGAEVFAVCSARNAEQARALGAHHVVDYATHDFTARADVGTGYDLIFDLVGSRPLGACLGALAPGGAYVSSVGRLGWMFKVALRALAVAIGGGPGRWPGRGPARAARLKILVAKPNLTDLATLTACIERGEVQPALDQRYALGAVPDALRAQARGHAQGKSVVVIVPE